MCRVQCSIWPHAGAPSSYSSSKRLRDTHSQGLLMSRRQCIMYTCSMRSCNRATAAHHAGLLRPRASGLASFATITGRNQKLHCRHARRSYRHPHTRIAFQDAWRETASAGGRRTGGSFRTGRQWLILRLTYMTYRTNTYSHANVQITTLPPHIRRADILSSHPNALARLTSRGGPHDPSALSEAGAVHAGSKCCRKRAASAAMLQHAHDICSHASAPVPRG